MAMKYGFIITQSSQQNQFTKIFNRYSRDEFSPSNPIEQFQQAFTSATSLWLNSDLKEFIKLCGFGKPLKKINSGTQSLRLYK